MKSNPLPKISHLIELFDYDPDSGVLRWKMSRGRVRSGSVAGRNLYGYTRVRIDGKEYPAHRIAIALINGYVPHPDVQVDHINGIGTDNRRSNLRLASQFENQQNLALRTNNSTGVAGVVWARRERKFMARICVNHRRYFLGYYETAEDAGQAYLSAKHRLHQFSPKVRPNALVALGDDE